MRTQRSLALALGVGVLANACSGDTTEPRTDSSVYTLAYAGPSGLELTDAAGTVHRTLVSDAYPLAWSPDGRSLALIKAGDNGTVWAINPDSSDLRQLIHFAPGTISALPRGTWAPSGHELLFEQQYGPNSFPNDLIRISVDGSFQPQRLFSASGELACSRHMQLGTGSDWSPDGSRIVVHGADYDNGPQVYTLSPDGTSPTFLVAGQQPDWSPDGSTIVFVAGPSACGGDRRAGRASLHLISPDGSNDRPLTFPAQNETDENPAWSPDGSKVAFVRLGTTDPAWSSDIPNSIVTSVLASVVDADGTNEHQLAVLSRNELDVHFVPAWSSDGRYVVFAGYGGTVVVNADGSGSRLVASTSQTCCPQAHWRP
jgi:Tol biopolymer transport system component